MKELKWIKLNLKNINLIQFHIFSPHPFCNFAIWWHCCIWEIFSQEELTGPIGGQTILYSKDIVYRKVQGTHIHTHTFYLIHVKNLGYPISDLRFVLYIHMCGCVHLVSGLRQFSTSGNFITNRICLNSLRMEFHRENNLPNI